MAMICFAMFFVISLQLSKSFAKYHWQQVFITTQQRGFLMNRPNQIQRLDPEISKMFCANKLAQGFDLDDVAAARRFYDEEREKSGPAMQQTEHSLHEQKMVTSYDGANILLNIVRPKQAGPHPAILWMHGGGFVMGQSKFDIPLLQLWAEQLQVVAASVEYRLAPEHPYPAGLEDAWSSLVSLGDKGYVDAGRIAIGGASAGGGLAAGLALLARDRGDVGLLGQALVYPMLDCRNIAPPQDEDDDFLVWSRANNQQAWAAYLGPKPINNDHAPIYASPSLAGDLSGLPPTFIPTGALDLFLHENMAYAGSLIAGGTPTELQVFPGACHAFNGFFPTAQVSKRCNQAIFDFFQRILQP